MMILNFRENKSSIRRPVQSILFVALVFVLLSTACNDTNQSNKPASTLQTPSQASTVQCTTHSSNPVTLTFAYSSEKQEWITDVVKDFNSRGITACDGPITVKAVSVASGQSMQDIVDGKITPDIWSPAGSVWLALINSLWQKKYGNTIVSTGANDTPSLVTSPVVIAMWKSEAEALGWPNKPIGWADIAALSTNPRGWAAYGHPEWGDFKFGHTNPDASNSGLDAVIAENYAALRKVRGLTMADISNSSTQDFVANVESSVIHYGQSTSIFADQMFTNGPTYLSAAVIGENLVVEANEGKKYPQVVADPVVAIYPKEGTFTNDHPFAILQGSWVTPAQKTSALAFRNFLLSSAQQQKALNYGFRPADLNLAVSSPIDTAHGVDPTEPKTLLQIPTAEIVQGIQASWQNLRRKVDVMLLLDHSGSMNETIGGSSKIGAARNGTSEFVNLLGNSDGLGLTIFSTTAEVLTPVSPLGPKRQEVLSDIQGITAQGSTRLFDTISEQVAALDSLLSKHIKVVIVLTDGIDTISNSTIDQLIRKINPSGANAGESAAVYTIAYGNDANVKELTRIASTTGGQEYAGTPQNIRKVYLQISEFL